MKQKEVPVDSDRQGTRLFRTSRELQLLNGAVVHHVYHEADEVNPDWFSWPYIEGSLVERIGFRWVKLDDSDFRKEPRVIS